MRLDARESGKHKVRKERRCETCGVQKERIIRSKEKNLHFFFGFCSYVFGVDGGDYESNDNGI